MPFCAKLRVIFFAILASTYLSYSMKINSKIVMEGNEEAAEVLYKALEEREHTKLEE